MLLRTKCVIMLMRTCSFIGHGKLLTWVKQNIMALKAKISKWINTVVTGDYRERIPKVFEELKSKLQVTFMESS